MTSSTLPHLICLISPVPCTPANISSEVDCEANSLIVSWSESSGADSYIATVQDSNGQTTTCQGTTEGSCNVTGIGCGQIYHASVVSSDGYCDSPSTPEVDTPSGRTDGQVTDRLSFKRNKEEMDPTALIICPDFNNFVFVFILYT